VLTRLFDEEEFLSPYGIRSLSRHHRDHPYQFHWDGQTHTVGYEPGESETPLFGGNSNWRGPVWFPVNFLLIEALERYHHFFGDSFRIELPTGSGHFVSLGAAADEIARRLSRLFLEGADGRRPADGGSAQNGDPILFHEYFHAETGAGLGASHQTGWTALVAKLLEDAGSSPASSGDAPASPLPPR
jgi:hypothetical protein